MINEKNLKIFIVSLLLFITGIYFVFGDEFLQPSNTSWLAGNITFNVSTTLPNTVNVTFYNLTAQDASLTNSKVIGTAVNQTGASDTRYFNFTWNTQSPIIAENIYLNITAKFTNSSNSNNYTNLTNIRIDNTLPISVFLAETETNNTFKNLNYILINVSITETNFANITFRIFNTTSQYNLSFFTNQTNQINISADSLNQKYTYNVTIRDLANNQNVTETRTITLDNTNPGISYSAQTEANNTQRNQNFIFINWTYTETNFANLTFRLFNTTSNVNTTTYNTTTYQINITGVNQNESYTYNVTIRDLANNQNVTETRTLTLDNVFPLIEFTSSTNANNTFSNKNSILINVSITENNEANITFRLFNSTSSVNETVFSGSNLTVNRSIDVSLSGSNLNRKFTYNVTIVNKANDANTTETRTITLDNTNPTATITEPSSTTITVSNSIKYTCDCSDGLSGVNTCTTKLTKSGGITIEKTGSGTEHTFTGTDTNEAGTYTVDCTAKDTAGNSGTATQKSFNALYSGAGGSGGGAGGGGSGGGGGGSAGSSTNNPVTIKQGENIDVGTLSTTETYTSIAKEGTVSFTVTGSSHSAKVLEVRDTSITVEISSTPQVLTLTVGETKDVDLTDDGKNDLSVTLKSITNSKADLVFKSLEVSAPGEQPSGEKPGVVTGKEAKPSLTWLWLLIVIIIIILFWYFSIQNKYKKRTRL